MSRKIPVSIQLTAQQKQWLDELSIKERRTKAVLISEAIDLLRASRETATPAKHPVRA